MTESPFNFRPRGLPFEEPPDQARLVGEMMAPMLEAKREADRKIRQAMSYRNPKNRVGL